MTGRAENDLDRGLAFNLRMALLAVLALCAHRGVASGQDLVRRDIPRSPPRSALEQAKLFRLPPGFRIDLVAADPEISKPINLNFDARGRLLVSQSVEYPFTPPPGQSPRDSIKLLVDEDRDGLPERVTTGAATHGFVPR